MCGVIVSVVCDKVVEKCRIGSRIYKQESQSMSVIKYNKPESQLVISDIHNPSFIPIDYSIKGNREYFGMDLFAGAGGLTDGFIKAGLNMLCAIEFEKYACLTHKRNFPNTFLFDRDIRGINTEEIKKIIGDRELDVISGGFPCQGFSMAGRRDINDERNTLYKEFHRIVKDLQPKYVVMENVPGLRSMQKGNVEKRILADFSDIGYPGILVEVLNSADYGVPQLRRRVFFIGNKLGWKNKFPYPLYSEDKYITTEEAIKDLEKINEKPEWNHEFTNHSEDMQKRLLAVPEGGNLYPKYSDAWKKCPRKKPSCTIKENHGGVNIHYKLPRVLTAREMARLQSFDDDFIFEGARKWQLVQVGNAVPPLMAKAVAQCVKQLIIGYELKNSDKNKSNKQSSKKRIQYAFSR